MSIERVERPDVARFRREYVKRSRPVVVVGATEGWRARMWTLDTLAHRLGDRQVELAVLRDGHAEVDRKIAYVTSSLHAFLGQVGKRSTPEYYLRLRLDRNLESLREDFTIPPYCFRSMLMDVSLLVGGAGTITNIHYDMLHNLVAQLRGHRRVTLFSPTDTAALYPHPMKSLRWHTSRVRLESPDVVAFPRFRDARPIEVELAPGEALFIPRGWWHHFEALETSISVHFFWLTPRLVPAMAAARLVWMLARENVN